MSQENVDLTCRAHDAFNRRELDAYLALMDAEVEFTPYEVSLEGGSAYRGHDAVRSWWEASFAVLPDLRSELYEVRDLGDVVLVHGRLRGTGAGSGASFDRTLWQAAEWRDGKCLWWSADASEAQALEAARRRSPTS